MAAPLATDCISEAHKTESWLSTIAKAKETKEYNACEKESFSWASFLSIDLMKQAIFRTENKGRRNQRKPIIIIIFCVKTVE